MKRHASEAAPLGTNLIILALAVGLMLVSDSEWSTHQILACQDYNYTLRNYLGVTQCPTQVIPFQSICKDTVEYYILFHSPHRWDENLSQSAQFV